MGPATNSYRNLEPALAGTENQSEGTARLNVSEIKILSRSCRIRSEKKDNKSWTHILHL
jgi:hypothetical protein